MKKSSNKLKPVKSKGSKNRIKRAISLGTLKKIISDLTSREDWEGLVSILKSLVKKDQADHWLMIGLASGYEAKEQFDLALKYSAAALRIERACPLVRWTHAYILMCHRQFHEAIDLLERLVSENPVAIGAGYCGHGSDCNLHAVRAKSLINDARLLLGYCYGKLNYDALHQFFREAYHQNVSNGTYTDFDADDVNRLSTKGDAKGKK
ncbi:hypothetical protein WBG78_07290 [Chryseolinea sp. T2]|uniref:tetratricopeptide repeat protein n=1 Tax=Chryseolinea sp. T2 TaxID=3129255 RepID=UPI003077B054